MSKTSMFPNSDLALQVKTLPVKTQNYFELEQILEINYLHTGLFIEEIYNIKSLLSANNNNIAFFLFTLVPFSMCSVIMCHLLSLTIYLSHSYSIYHKQNLPFLTFSMSCFCCKSLISF